MYVYMHVCVSLYIYICVYMIFDKIHIYICTYTHICIEHLYGSYMYIYVYLSRYYIMYICIYTYIHIYIYAYLYMYMILVYIYICNEYMYTAYARKYACSCIHVHKCGGLSISNMILKQTKKTVQSIDDQRKLPFFTNIGKALFGKRVEGTGLPARFRGGRSTWSCSGESWQVGQQ